MYSSFVRFVVTGLFGFGVDFTIAWVFIHMFSFFEPIANTISAAFAVTINFLVNNYWSFSHKKIAGGVKQVATKYSQFALVAVGSVAIQGIGMFIALSVFGSWALYIFGVQFSAWILYKIVIIVFFIIPYSYIMYNRIIWRHDTSKNSQTYVC